MDQQRHRILLGEAARSFRPSLKKTLEGLGFQVVLCINGVEVVQKCFDEYPDLIILEADLPQLSGAQCCRVLKTEPSAQSIPIILTGSGERPLERYWCLASGADHYLGWPLEESDLERAVRQFLTPGTPRRRSMALPSRIPDAGNLSLLSYCNAIMERELLKAEIMNEIGLIDVKAVSFDRLIRAVMRIVDSLFPINLGVTLLTFQDHGEVFFYQTERFDQKTLDEIKTAMLHSFEERSEQSLQPEHIHQTVLNAPSIAENGGEIQEFYIHEKNCRQSRCILAFNNMGFEDADKDERRILEDILDLIQDVLEKKVYYEMLQEQSMLDAFTNPGAMAGFIKRLEREIEKSKRSGVPMTLFTIEIPGFAELTKGLERQRVQAIRRFLWKVALHVTSKSDVVMRRDAASFVFLFKSARADKARRLQKAICRFLSKKLPKYLNSSARLELATGLCQFDPNRDRTPDAFLAHAKPRKTWPGDKIRKPVVYLNKIQRKEIFEASQVNRNTAAL